MALYKRNGSSLWWVEFEFRGQRIRKSTGTASHKKAKDYESKLRHELHDRAVMGNGSATSMTIGEAVERYISTHLRLRKKREKSKKADAFLLDSLIERIGGENVTLDSLDTKAISEFKMDLIQLGLAPASVNKYLASLKAILRKANREWGTLAVVPNITLLPLNNNRLRWLTDDEEMRLLAECEQTTHLKNLVTFLLDTGARLSEATHLTWGNLDLTRKPRGIVRFMETKSGKPRSVPLASRTQGMLTKLWEIRPEGQSRVFLVRLPGCKFRKTKPQAKPFHHPYGGWYAALERSGLADVVIHDLRHTFASRLVQKGVPLLAVSKLLGHSSLTMTMRYAHLAPDNLDEAIDRLDDPPAKPPSNGNGDEEKPGH